MQSDAVISEMTLKIAKQVKACKEWIIIREGDDGKVVGINDQEDLEAHQIIEFKIDDVAADVVSDEEFIVIGKKFAREILVHANKVIGEAYVEERFTPQDILADWSLE